MKKLFVMLLTLTILAVPVTAYGGEDTIGKNENRSIDVQAKYANGTDTPDVYSVNVVWGAMQFTYTVTVTNHSNKDVNVSFAYAKASGFEDVNGAFSVESKTLNAGTVDDVAGADGVSTKLTLSGTLASNITNFTKVGSITVSLN